MAYTIAMTQFYYVWVRSNKYHGNEPLTYASEQRLVTGQIVAIPLQRETVTGVISGIADRPRFKTKPITQAYDLPPIPTHLLKLAQWLQSYYPAPIGILTQQLIPGSFSNKLLQQSADWQPVSTLNQITADLSSLPPLSQDQSAALAIIKDRDTYVVHGQTGSGKTRLYIELSQRALMTGKSAIILTPEISLTTQLAGNFAAVFGDRVIILHSEQAPNERQSAWLNILRAHEPVIVIGPRSALFSPIAKLGLIVLDESHEAAYKQVQSPQYQTGRVASTLAALTRSSLVLGSATPSINDYYLAQQKQKPIIELRRLLGKSELPATETVIVDLKDRDQFSRSTFISQPLLELMQHALARSEQSLLYLNRRGTARLVLCEHCGWQANCPHCDVPLTYHGDSYDLRCHSCDYHAPVPSSCPDCRHPSVIFKTAGTKAVVDEVARLFPRARLMRFDTDNSRAERFEQHFDAIHNGEVDILIGTQLLAKGLDLPKLSVVGVLLADTSLYLPDFSAEERTFQLISQVIGRVGRGHVAGHTVIQTYHPEHPILRESVTSNYQSFYARELAQRQLFRFPPFCYLLKLTARRASSRAAELAAQKLKTQIETSGATVRVEGPAPSFYEKFQNKYQWQLIIKAVDRTDLLTIIATLPANWSYDLDPSDLL
jgi:primosomal protein N' (replication factor Y)